MILKDLIFKEHKDEKPRVVKPKPKFHYSKFRCVLIDPVDSMINFDNCIGDLVFNSLDKINIKHGDCFLHKSLYCSVYDTINRYRSLSSEDKDYIKFYNLIKKGLSSKEYLDKLYDFSDAMSALQFMKNQGVELITISNLPSSFLRLAYQKFGYNGFFDTILSDNKFLDKQSRIDNVIQFNRLFDYDPEEILVIGNSSYCYDIASRLNTVPFCIYREGRCDTSYQRVGMSNSLEYIINNW